MRNSIRKDTLFYLVGTLVPTLISVLRSPVFTRYFTPEEYGYYSIVFIAFSFAFMVLFTSLSSCIWRYYNKHKNSGTLSVLYSNLSLLYVASFLIILIFSIVWVNLSHQEIIRKLIYLCFINYFTAEIISFYLIIYKLESKASTYNVLQSVKSITSFLILLSLTFIFNFRIEAILLSNILVQACIVAYLVFFSKIRLKIRLHNLSFSEMKQLINYGSSGVLINVFLIILLSSDRYIIKLYSRFSDVGIYNQIYNLGQISIAALANVYMSAITPRLTQALETRLLYAGKMIRLLFKNYILMLWPVTVFFSLFSKQVSHIMLGKEFQTGYTMIPYIMISACLYGCSLPLILKLKFENKISLVVIGTMLAAFLNIVLNFIFIPLFDYKVAALTTLAAYALLFVYIVYVSKIKLLSNNNYRKFLIKIILILFVEVLFDLCVRRVFKLDIPVVATILEGLFFLVIFYWFTNKKDMNFILRKVLGRVKKNTLA